MMFSAMYDAEPTFSDRLDVRKLVEIYVDLLHATQSYCKIIYTV